MDGTAKRFVLRSATIPAEVVTFKQKNCELATDQEIKKRSCMYVMYALLRRDNVPSPKQTWRVKGIGHCGH